MKRFGSVLAVGALAFGGVAVSAVAAQADVYKEGQRAAERKIERCNKQGCWTGTKSQRQKALDNQRKKWNGMNGEQKVKYVLRPWPFSGRIIDHAKGTWNCHKENTCREY